MLAGGGGGDARCRGSRGGWRLEHLAANGFDQVATAGFYDDAGFCQDCDAPYCYRHCPLGHGKSLDPHW